MGADFLYCTCPRFEVTSKRLTQLRRVVRNIPGCEVSMLAKEYGRECDDVTATILQAVKQLPEMDSRRDVSTIVCGNMTHWITGGMSWGDAPTEAFDWLVWLQMSSTVQERISRWAQEDARPVKK